jgi:hypothetical protein
MAGIKACVQTPEITLVAATAKTVLQIVAPTNQRLMLKRWGVFFDGTSSTAEPVQVRLLRQTTAIGGSPTTVTPVRLNAGSETLQATAASSAGGSEPTASDVLDVFEVHPQTGVDVVFPLDQDVTITGGTRLGIECTAPAGVNVRAKMWYEE